MSLKFRLLIAVFAVIIIVPTPVFAMHIAEGFLPLGWSIAWTLIAIPFIAMGLYSIKKTVQANHRMKMLLGLAGAFTFVLSALKLPSVTGSCSHPTGTGLGTILFGPLAMSVLGCIVLLFQALLLAHGGITTLGANTFSMAIIGPFAAFVVYKLAMKLKAPQWLAVFLAATIGDIVTYICTSIQLALAFPSEAGGFGASLAKFMGVFAFTQLPLAIGEGLLTVVIFNLLIAYNREELNILSVTSRGN